MGPSLKRYTTVDATLAQVMSKIRPGRKVEAVPSHLAYGRVSARRVVAPSDVPASPTSHWDGYAARSEDTDGATKFDPVSLKVVGQARPGGSPRLSVRRAEAVQVATGAPMPSGADTVVPVESVELMGDEVLVREPSPAGSHVYRAGEDVRKGDVVLRKGQTIRAQDLGLLLSLGFTKTEVRLRPKAAVLATGTELAAAGAGGKGKVVNSHSPLFVALLQEFGCTPSDEGIAKDDPTLISRRMRSALAGSDILITLGGTSAGKRDYAVEAVSRLSPDLLVHGIKMDRGRVSGVAVVRGKPVVMMPGPIQGAMNAFFLLAAPLIEAVGGMEGRGAEVPCAFRDGWEARRRYADFRKVVYVKLEGGPQLLAKPLEAETESMRVLSEADGFAVIPENVTRIDRGERVMVRLLPGFSYA